MGTALIIAKIMPDSPDTNLDEIKNEATKLLGKLDAKSITFEEKPIAFGLKAIMVKFAIPEDKGSDVVETQLASIKNVSSATIEDYRRAFG